MIKKANILLILIFAYTSVEAQYKYRVEFDIDFPTRSGNGGDKYYYKMSLANSEGETTGPIVFDGFVVNTEPHGAVNRTANFIIDTDVEYSGMNLLYNSAFSTTNYNQYHEFSCESNGLEFGPVDVIDVNYFRVYPATLAIANDYDSGTNTLLECKTKVINIAAVECNGTVYGVEYQIGSNTTTWNTLLPYAERPSSFDIQKSDFLNLNINESLRIRILHNDIDHAYSDILTYIYGVCSPNVTSFSTQPTICSDSSNGRFTLNLDRALNSGETLAMVLRRDNPTTGPIISSFTGISYTGTSYQWPNDLPTSTYYLRYQTETTGNVIDVGPVIIASPSPVLFSTSWTNIDCFGENTGSISINASGGAGSYQYSINNGSTWSNFSNATLHKVTNLPTGNYKVKVRDANNCVAQL